MKVALVLGGGGARGFAHIGVLKAMEERGLKPMAIAGCSMGGLVGAMISAGHNSKKITQIVTTIKPWDLLDRSRMGALIGGKGMAHEMEKYLPKTFEELNFPLSVTAVDIQEGSLMVFSKGPLYPALRATSSLPGIISPEKCNGHYYIDGGLLNNLPVDVINAMTDAPVIAVDVASPRNRKIPLEESVLKRAKSIVKGQKRPLVFELFMKAFDVPSTMLTETRLALNPPELLLRPKLNPDLKTEDMGRYDEAITAGYKVADEALDAFVKTWQYKNQLG